MPELLEYVRAAHKAGFSNKEIVQKLQLAGWTMDDFIASLASENFVSHIEPGIINVQNLSKSFGKLNVLNSISFSVQKGRVLALLGPNGAGKTTLVRILATLLKFDSGSILIGGFDLIKESNKVKATIGLTGQFAAIDEYLTGRENLELIGNLYHLDRQFAKYRAKELLDDFGLSAAGDRLVSTYSGGMKRRLDIAASLVNRPRVLFLDEPTTGLDPQSRIALWGIIKKLTAEGTTVLLTTQYLEEADHLSDDIMVINHGEIIARGTADELKMKIGGDVLEIHLLNSGDSIRAAKVLSAIGKQGIRSQEEVGIITVPAPSGSADLMEAVRALDAERIKIADIMLRRPSLDDVFLALTGHAVELSQ